MKWDDRHDTDDITNAELVNLDTFEKLKSRNRRKKIFRRIGLLFSVLLMSLIVVVGCMALFLKIEYINVTGNTLYSSEDIINESGISVGMNLYAINKKTSEASIMSSYPYVGDVTIRRTLPSTVTLRITEEPPKYYTEIYGEYFVLSTAFRVLERSEDLEYIRSKNLLPIMLPDVKTAIVGEKVGFKSEVSLGYLEEFLKAVEACEVSKRLTSIDVSSKYNIYVTLEDRFRIYLGTSSDAETKLVFAEMIINTFDADKSGEVDAHDITLGSVILDN